MKDLQIWLDDVLGRITMYRLIIYGLGVIAAFAAFLMLTGYLTFSLPGFLLSLVLCNVVSYGINRLLGWLFGLHPQAESAMITAFIIALLFTPPTSVLEMVKILLVVIIANLSKYALVIRNKHVFNPAAAAIVIGSVSGLAYATWWIGSPGLLPVTLIVALLILYKVQKLQMAGLFLVVSVVMIFILSVVHGDISGQNIGLALTSWPLVFFAGIMLCEPLTMAPRRKQQLAIAVLVAILLPLGFHYGHITMTPALALVIGNTVAFWFSVRQTVKLRLAATKKQGSDGYEMVFDVAPLSFVPGQYIELSLPHRHADSRGMRRVFSIIGVPKEHQLSIATRLPEKRSSFKKALSQLKPGKTIYGTRVAGDFVLPEDPSVPVVCVAGGVGITPFISFILTGSRHPLTILYVVRSMADIMFVDTLRQYDANVIVVTSDDGKLPDREWAHEQKMIDQSIVNKYIHHRTEVYISGPPGIVTSVKHMAKLAGAAAIHTDHFTGY